MQIILILISIFLSSCFLPVSADNNLLVEDGRIYLWREGNMPSLPEHENLEGNPYMEVFTVPDGMEVRGAVMVCPGGAFEYLSPQEGRPVAEELAGNGYVSFVVYYRVRPYSMDESTLDLARAIRIAKSLSSEYGYSPDDIAAVGFSAGGILIGNEALFFDGSVNGSTVVTTWERSGESIDPGYIPDEIDNISADLRAVGMCYSFYGILSHASVDTDSFIAGEIPPTYFCYGTNEIFRSEIERCIAAVNDADVPAEVHVIPGFNHGFGASGDWISSFIDFLDTYINRRSL